MAVQNAVYIIAEIGSNHGGDLDTAFQYIEASAKVGADAVKFQSWKTSTLQNAVNIETGEVDPGIGVLEKYELPAGWHAKLKVCCDEHDVDFLSTPFDLGRARLLRDLGCAAIKIASGDLTYTQLLNEVAGYGLPVILSTGMADVNEISVALESLGPARAKTTLLHCVGGYPPDIEDANLLAIKTLADNFSLPVGLSDHYPGSTTAIAAVALGARVIEKHVTFSRKAGHPDSPFAMEMGEFGEMIKQVRLLEKALGDGDKICRPSESGGKIGGRRSLYWLVDLDEGSEIVDGYIAALRPAKGEFSPSELESLLGKKLDRAVKAGSPVSHFDFYNE